MQRSHSGTVLNKFLLFQLNKKIFALELVYQAPNCNGRIVRCMSEDFWEINSGTIRQLQLHSNTQRGKGEMERKREKF